MSPDWPLRKQKEIAVLLNIDIGNTTTAFAVCRGLSVIKLHIINNQPGAHVYRKRVAAALGGIRKRYPLKAIMLCSVVPKLESGVCSLLKKSFELTPVVVGRTATVPIVNNYKNRKQVGQDRLVCAYAAKKLYGVPAIIIDLGTAITFDVVTNKGHYDGGMIVPGIKMSTESLFYKTALLPGIKRIAAPRRLIGKTTEESILSGIFYGYGEMCSGLITRISKKFTNKPKIIVTGGHTGLMKKFISRKITAVEPHLIFKGLTLIYEEVVSKSGNSS